MTHTSPKSPFRGLSGYIIHPMANREAEAHGNSRQLPLKLEQEGWLVWVLHLSETLTTPIHSSKGDFFGRGDAVTFGAWATVYMNVLGPCK